MVKARRGRPGGEEVEDEEEDEDEEKEGREA